MSRYGQYAVAEPHSSLRRRHRYAGEALQPVSHPPAIPVLNQGNLLEQGIHTSELVPGAKDVPALGSCVFNATAAHVSQVLAPARVAAIGLGPDPVADEKWSIVLYHQTSDLTGNPAQEWPPTDCGSNGLYVCQELERRGVISGWKIAHTPQDILSMMQAGSLIVGQPWFYAWEEPGANGFYDGDGSPSALEAAVRSGVAGGHETCWWAIEQIGYTATGEIDPFKTVITMRQSWGMSWGDHGNGRLHLSTYMMLAGYCDFRQMTA